MKESWIVFYVHGKEKAAYTVRGTFAGELEAVRELIAEENGVEVDEVDIKVKMR